MLSSLAAFSLFLLAGIGFLLRGVQARGISAVAEGYSSVLLRENAGEYIVVGVAAFVAGVALTGTVGILGACTGLHAIYNLLITADGAWKTAGYLFPSALILCLYLAKRLLPKLNISFE